MSRTKGHSYERAVAAYLRDKGHDEARRGLQYRDGDGAPDVILDGWNIECKRLRVVRWGDIIKALAQAHDSPHAKGRFTVAIMRPDRGDDIVCMRRDEWAELVGEIKNGAE